MTTNFYIFQVYDTNNDGVLKEDDLYDVLRAMMEENILIAFPLHFTTISATGDGRSILFVPLESSDKAENYVRCHVT